MKNNDTIELIVKLLAIIVALSLLLGWVLNVYKFIESDFEAPYKSEIIRSVGIPVGIVGAIIGYFKIGDEK